MRSAFDSAVDTRAKPRLPSYWPERAVPWRAWGSWRRGQSVQCRTMNAALPVFVLDYPEAHVAVDAIQRRVGPLDVTCLPALGERPVSAEMLPHALPSKPFIVVNGSGNYHHETVPLVEGFLAARPGKTFTYVQIDAHPDKDDRFRWKCDCASFVGRLLKHPGLVGLWQLGIYPPCLEDTTRPGHLFTPRLGYYGENYFRRLHTYVADGDDITELFWQFQPDDLTQAQQNPSVAEVRVTEQVPPPLRKGTPSFLRDESPRPCLEVRWQRLTMFDPSRALPEHPLYLSIDLDVCQDKPTTDWTLRGHAPPRNSFGVVDNQGVLSWEQLIALVERLGEARPIAAADFCGLTKRINQLPAAARVRSLDGVCELYEVLSDAIQRGHGRGEEHS